MLTFRTLSPKGWLAQSVVKEESIPVSCFGTHHPDEGTLSKLQKSYGSRIAHHNVPFGPHPTWHDLPKLWQRAWWNGLTVLAAPIRRQGVFDQVSVQARAQTIQAGMRRAPTMPLRAGRHVLTRDSAVPPVVKSYDFPSWDTQMAR